MTSIWNSILLIATFLRFCWNPYRTETIFQIVERAMRIPKNESSIQTFENELLRHPELRADWESRRPLPTIDLQKLTQFPPNTLGYVYAQYLEKNQLRPDFYKSVKIERPAEYFLQRMYETHDLWHVLLDYDITLEGEAELQAFMMAQIPSQISFFILNGLYLHAAFAKGDQAADLYRKSVQAYQRGIQSQFILGLHLENQLATDLSQLRQSIQK